MNTMNVNGQNGVATSAAIKNAVVKAVKMINKAENAKRGYVKMSEGTRLSFDGQRFIKEGKDNFIFNGWIEYKGTNGRYTEQINVSYKNLDNEEGLCLNDMVNGVIDAILNYIDNTIVRCNGGDGFNAYYAEILQNFRYCYFGSRLVVDNTDNLNSPDALDNDIESIMEFFGDDYKTLNDIENEFFGYHFDIDDDLRDNLLFKRNGSVIDMYNNNMDIIDNSVYIRLTDIKNIRDFENALFELISTLINNDENNEPDALVDAMVKNFIDDFYGKPENELDLSKVHSYLEFVSELNYTTHRDFENDLLALMTANLHQISVYLTTLYNWEIMPMADDDDLKMAFQDRVSDCMHNIKDAIKTYVTERDKIAKS